MKTTLLLWFALLLSSRGLAQPVALPAASLASLLDSAGVPGVALAVINQQGVAWAKGYGVRAAGNAALVDQYTVFSAASLGKPVFAYLVLKLVEAGKLDLDKPLYQYMPYHAIEQDARYKRITARMVLSHQTGFPNWRQGQLKLLFPPSQRFSYSGEGFVYLQGVVMTIMGQDVEQLAQQYVFQPLGMRRTSYRWQAAFEDNYATPHTSFGQGQPLPRFTEPNVAYSLQTTAADYARFLVAVLTGEGLQPATAQAWFTPQVTPGRTLHDTTQASAAIRWGLGLGLVHTADEEGFWHWGDNGGFRGFAYVSRTCNQGFVYFTNSRNGASLFAALARRTLQQSVQPVTDFLSYPAYRSAAIQVSRRLIRQGVRAATTPFLPTKSRPADSPKSPRLTQEELLELADELTSSGQCAQAVDLLALGSTAYPHAPQLLKSYGYACLQQGDYPRAAKILQHYVATMPGDDAARSVVEQLTRPARGNVTLRLPAFPTAHLITLAGSFNDWQPLRTLFVKEKTGWRCTLQLPKGNYPYKLIVDGTWQTDPTNPHTEVDGQNNANSILIVTKD